MSTTGRVEGADAPNFALSALSAVNALAAAGEHEVG
jgi:hypothetical protein